MICVSCPKFQYLQLSVTDWYNTERGHIAQTHLALLLQACDIVCI